MVAVLVGVQGRYVAAAAVVMAVGYGDGVAIPVIETDTKGAIHPACQHSVHGPQMDCGVRSVETWAVKDEGQWAEAAERAAVEVEE